MIPSNIRRAWRHTRQWFTHRCLHPWLRRLGNLFLRWSQPENGLAEQPESWKRKALDDFSQWLADLPETTADGEPSPEACDLYTLLTEFAALRQEIKIQTRQQRTTLKTQVDLADRFQQIDAALKTRIAHLDKVNDALRHGIEEKTIWPFLDIRDALVRGEAAAELASQKRSFWRPLPKNIDAVVQGYAMAIRRLDHALEVLGIRPIISMDQPFDAARMRAVGRRHAPGKDAGIVVEEVAGGFERSDRVLRTAEVIVSTEKQTDSKG
jgi:molecular chaperone GrpE (heat shock protein)